MLRAYRDLSRPDWSGPGCGLGTFVTRSLARPGTEDDSPLRADLAARVVRARAAGLERDDVLALVTAALDAAEPAAGPHRHAPGDRDQKREDA